MNITCFKVNLEVARDGILKKKKQVYTALLDSYAARLRDRIAEVKYFPYSAAANFVLPSFLCAISQY